MWSLGWSAAALVFVIGCKFSGGIAGPSTSPSSGSSARSGPSAGASRNLATPNVMFMTRAEAEATIARSGFERPPNIDNNSLCGSVVDDKIVELGRVCYQHPPAGREMGSRIPVTIRVQTENPYGGELGGGRRWFLMPNLVGQHVDQAKARVRELGFVTKEVKLTYSDDASCRPNIVCKTYPAAMQRTDTTSDKLFYVGKDPDAPKPGADPSQPTPPAKPSMGDAF